MGIVRKYDAQPTPNVLRGRNAQTDGADTEVIAADGSQTLMMDSLSVVNTSITTVYVDILSAGTVIWTIAAPPNGGGSNMAFPKPIPGIAAGNLSARVSGSATTVYISIGAHSLPTI